MNENSHDEERVDFSVGEDPDLICIADACHQANLRSVKDRIEAALRGDAFMLSLPEDFGITGRLVVGELDCLEQETWVARASRSIQLETGKLVVDGGGFFGRQTDPQVTQSVDYSIFQFPPGRYTLTCYAYLCSDVATDLFRRRKLSYIELFRRSHPSEPIPVWLFELAADRDNDLEEEELETVDEATLDDSQVEVMIEYVLQLQPAESGTQESGLSAKGKLRWEKRWPKTFPRPLLSAEHPRAAGTKDLTKTLINSFAQGDFEASSDIFTRFLRGQVGEFLATQFAAITKKMSIPTRIRRQESLALASDWLEKTGLPNALVDTRAIEKERFIGSTFFQLVGDGRHRHEEVSVSFNLAFVKTDAGIRAAGIKMEWCAPRPAKRRKRVLTGPPCPKCGERLASEHAKQCIHCGADSH
ncbi:hypothetical protein CA13_19260 [Planctomycetes bacterium CA13]|uniref:Uncharacterized protein n=1 Tax=Novipirellula herctigrandis TaxID=2527986 RepID=A0A5C5Z0H6_9BACT|nr:hypothetical protein CA13_19260 [Planctomycetes bacterium CA13]